MKKINAAVLTSALVLATLTSVPSSANPSSSLQDCTCQALDGSCSVTVNCKGQCQKYCGNNGDCWAECSGFYGALGLETNLEMPYGNDAQLTSLLAQTTGQDISFTRTKTENGNGDMMFQIGFRKTPLWDALQFLADRGAVRIGGRDFESIRKLRKALLSGQRLNFGVSHTPVNTFVTDLAGITGLPLRITSGNPMTMANVELPQATLDEIIDEVSRRTGTKIVERGSDANTH